jgi:hypothetical protein
VSPTPVFRRFGLLSLILTVQVAGYLLYANIRPRYFDNPFRPGETVFVCGWPRLAYQSFTWYEASRGWVTAVHPPGFDLIGVGINVVVCGGICVISLVAVEILLRQVYRYRDSPRTPTTQPPSSPNSSPLPPPDRPSCSGSLNQ